MFGLDPETNHAIRNVFETMPLIKKVVLYGSRAMGTYKNGSDIDLTLLGENLKLDTVYAVMDKLDELYLPYKFDLSIFDQIDNADLIDHIQRVGKVFYQREKNLPDDW